MTLQFDNVSGAQDRIPAWPPGAPVVVELRR